MVKSGIVGALSYARLEEALTCDVRGLARRTAGGSEGVWILVPSNLVAQHLMRAVARASGGVLGPRCLTLRQAAARLAGRSLARRGMRPLPSGAAELVLDKALAELPAGSHFGRLQRYGGSAGAILYAIKLLKNALWRPEGLAQAAQHLAGADPDASRRFRELAALWAALEQFAARHGLFDDEDLLLAAARPQELNGAAQVAEAPRAVLFYGFYDLTPLQRELVARIAAGADVRRAYLLWDEEDCAPGPGFEYARPTVEFLRALLGVGRIELLGDVAGAADLLRLRRGLFRMWPPRNRGAGGGEGIQVAADGTVRIVHCPGEVSEAEEIAREVLRRCRGLRDRLSVGILARTPEAVAEALSEALERAGIRYYMSEGRPLARAIPGRILLRLLELADSEAERGVVIEFLSVAGVQWPEGLHVTALDRLSRLAGIVRGWEAWVDGLLDLAQSRLLDAQRAELDSECAVLEEEARLGRMAAEFLREFFARVRRLRRVVTWRGMAQELGALAEAFIPQGADGRSDALGLVARLGWLDVTGLPAGVNRAAWVLGRFLRQASREAGGFQRSGVAFSGIMTARGVTFDAVFVPRLLEKDFPLRIPSDPVLSDRDRHLLNSLSRTLGAGELPVQLRRPEEERYLFRIALGSAVRAVVLSYPRIEQDAGRALIPSRFVQETCDALCGEVVGVERIESGELGGLARRVRWEPPGPPDDALDGWEYDVRAYRQAPGGQAIPYTEALSDCFRMAVRMDTLRWSRRELGPYDGKIREAHLLARLLAEHRPEACPLSPSRLEAYAQCPFRYFLQYVLGIEEFAEPVEEVEIAAVERGRLIHEWYREVYAQKLTGRLLGELRDSEIGAVVEFASAQIERLGAGHAAVRPAVWAATKRELLGQLVRVLRMERAENADAAPQRYEFAFGPGQPAGAFRFPLAGGRAIQVQGRIDRLDRLGSEGVQIVDYKSGRRGTAGYRADSFAGGRQLQLPLYLLAASAALGRQRGRARYLFIQEARFLDEFTVEKLCSRAQDLRRIVDLVLSGIRSGDFFPLPPADRPGREHCRQYCAFRAVCGPARAKLAAVKDHAGNVSDLGRLWQLRDIQ